MKRVIKIGMDVHSKEHVLCAVEPKLGGEPEILAERKVPADFKHVLKFAAELRQICKDPTGLTELEFECGYEAGCLGILPLQSADGSRRAVCHSGTDNNDGRTGQKGEDRCA